MNILITGANGFVGKNLVAALKNMKEGKDRVHTVSVCEIMEYDVDSSKEELDEYCKKADFVFHLAGVNRPQNSEDFMTGNAGFTGELLETLKRHNSKASVMISSSIQATLAGRFQNSEYGKSKLAGEEMVNEYAHETGVPVMIYRFPNLFGKWARPNYNSAVSTFCYNISHDMEITVNDRNTELTLLYIDDLIEEMLAAMAGHPNRKADGFCYAEPTHTVTLGEIADLLYEFHDGRKKGDIPDMTEGSFSKKLYATYLSYLDPNNFSYPLKMNVDARGSFTEIIHTAHAGQFSVNISKPGITKGQHWHHTKNEKFVVVKGHGLIQLRKIGTDENGQPYPVVNYEVNGEQITVVDMIPGYTHNIINLSDTEDLVTFMWANECFNPNKPDTFFEEV